MAYRDKSRQVNNANTFNRSNYDRITLMLPKGERDRLKAAAKAAGKSLNEYIKEAIRLMEKNE